MAQYACECCGHRTLERPPGGTYQICPVCFWEDAPYPDEDVFQAFSNGITLREAQRCFEAYQAAGRDFIDAVRPPLPEEARNPGWQSIDQTACTTRQPVLDEIAKAFAGVTRNGGVSLHETVAIDSYGLDSLAPDTRTDTGRNWLEVSPKTLSEICGVGGISFLDPIGWRYYLPAYMTWWLTDGEQSESVAAENLLYSLRPCTSDTNGLRSYALERYRSLSADQSEATARFLNFVRDFAEDCYTMKHAQKALDSYWSRFVTG